MKQWLRDYFGFSRLETHGFFWLSGCMFLLMLTPTLVKYWALQQYQVGDKDSKKLESLVSSLEETMYSEYVPEFVGSSERITEQFDPNQADAKTWKAAGLPNQLADRIANYTAKGGYFMQKEDLLKIYGMSTTDYEKVVHLVEIKPKTKPTYSKKELFKYEPRTYAKVEITHFEINSADSVDLTQIKGIGAKTAQRILNYRDKLGGFASQNQLYEVWGLDSLVIDELLKFTLFENDKIKTIQINAIDEKSLAEHPYISPKLAKVIIAYRNQHGQFKSSRDLLKIRLVDQEWLDKIKHYLNFN